MNLDWLAGFVEGEASFTGSWRTETYFQPKCHIYQNDRSILEAIRTYLVAEHQIDMVLSREGVGVGSRRNCSYLGLNSIGQCDKLYHLLRPRMFIPTKIVQIDTWHEKLGYKGRNVKHQLQCIT